MTTPIVLPCEKCGEDVTIFLAGDQETVAEKWAEGIIRVYCGCDRIDET